VLSCHVRPSSGLRPSARSLLLALTAAIDDDQQAANGDGVCG
jgi:hypothetical protein